MVQINKLHPEILTSPEGQKLAVPVPTKLSTYLTSEKGFQVKTGAAAPSSTSHVHLPIKKPLKATPPAKTLKPKQEIKVVIDPLYTKPKTQKAHGITCLNENSDLEVPEFSVWFDPSQLKGKELGFKKNKWFARPCPLTPRHGFVESRKVNKLQEVISIFKEAKAVDPAAELVLMRAIKATHSAIWLPEQGMLAIGLGHDGATGGEESLQLHLVPEKRYILDAKWGHGYTPSFSGFKEIARIKKDEALYIELVRDEKNIYGVQARSGPKPPKSQTDYIPQNVKVAQIITPTKNLLAWEELTASLKNTPGVVAWKSGATLSCHAAIHCILNKIPFITSKTVPVVGSTLEKNEKKVVLLKQEEANQGFNLGLQFVAKDFWDRNILHLAVAFLHSYSSLRKSADWSYLYGWMMGTIFRAGTISCFGEARHVKHQPAMAVFPHKSLQRQKTWEEIGMFPIESYIQRCRALPFVLMHKSFNDGYGGWKWAKGALHILKMYDCFLSGEIEKALSECNHFVNQCHNGGLPILSKFGNCSEEELETLSDSPSPQILSNLDKVYELIQVCKLQSPIHPPEGSIKSITTLKKQGLFLSGRIEWPLSSETEIEALSHGTELKSSLR